MNWNRIESRQNSAVKLAASLADKKARDRSGLFAAEGKTLFLDLIRRGMVPRALYLADFAFPFRETAEKMLEGKECECYLLSDSAFEKVTTEKGSEGILSLFPFSELEKHLVFSQPKKLVALENVQDPGNVGTVIRTAASFGFDGVLLTGSADAFSPKAIRASMGAVAHVPVRTFPKIEDLMAFLEEWQVPAVATCLHSDSVSIEKTDLAPPVCVLIGNEGKGLSETAVKYAKAKSIIPIENMESLNAAVAASVFLWEVAKREREQ